MCAKSNIYLRLYSPYLPPLLLLLSQDDKLMAENNASVKDMEAAAVAYVAELAKVPFLALKVVTDIVDGDRVTQEEFFENLAAASASLQEKIPKVIKYVMGKQLSEL